MYLRTLLLLIFLFPAVALGDKLGPDLGLEKNTPSPVKKPALPAKTQALVADINSTDQALEKSREYQQEGKFDLARIVLLHGLEISASSTEDTALLVEELDYNLPLLQAKELLVLGKPDEAEAILENLAEKFSANQKRTDEISALRGALSQSRLLQTARRDNEREVTRDVRKRLSRYYREHGAFPSYIELNRILPANDDALQNYEVIYFKSVPNAYRMVLRNLHNKDNMLKIEATGLIK